MPTKVEEIAGRLAKLSPDAQAKELEKLERNVTKQEAKAQKGALDEHKVGIASVMVDAAQMYANEKRINIDVLIPLRVSIARSEDGKAIQGTVTGRGSKGGGGNAGPRGERFLAAAGIVNIELNGTPIAKCAESEVLRLAHGAKVAKDVYGSASPHVVASKPENVKLIREKGFVAVTTNGSKRPLADFYTSQ